MGSKSDYLENKILNYVLKGTAFSAPAGVYVGLFNVIPTDAYTPAGDDNYGGGGGNGNEVPTAGGTGYARVQATGGSAFSTATTGSSSNGGTITFPTATADWKTGANTQIVGFGIFDNATPGAGNLLYWGAVTPNKTILNGDTASFTTGALVITED